MVGVFKAERDDIDLLTSHRPMEKNSITKGRPQKSPKT